MSSDTGTQSTDASTAADYLETASPAFDTPQAASGFRGDSARLDSAHKPAYEGLAAAGASSRAVPAGPFAAAADSMEAGLASAATWGPAYGAAAAGAAAAAAAKAAPSCGSVGGEQPPADDAAGMPDGGTLPALQPRHLQQHPSAAPPPSSPEHLALPRLSPSLRSLSLGRRGAEVWGWLRPAAGTKLPFVLLQGKGVAIGRGRDFYYERLTQLVLSRASSSPKSTITAAGSSSIRIGSPSDSGPLGSVPSPGSGATIATAGAHPGSSNGSPHAGIGSGDSAFVEIADGRVSRLHAWVKWDAVRQQAVLEDLSSNGSFLNGERLGRGRSAPLADGDRLSLVLSVAPLAEQAFIYRRGDPRGQESEAAAEWLEEAGRVWQHTTPAESPTATGSSPAGFAERGGSSFRRLGDSFGRAGSSSVGRSGSGGSGQSPAVAAAAAAAASARRLARCQTSQYSTLHATTLEDLQCQICLSVLRDCVALDPCGHNYCAACLSHHLAALLTSGQPLACPLRCVPPERVMINTAVRQLLSAGGLLLLQQLRNQHSRQQSAALPSALESLPEALSSGSSCLPSGSSLPSLPPTALSSQDTELPPEQLSGSTAARARPTVAEAAQASTSSPRQGGASSEAVSPQYRHVTLSARTPSGGSPSSPPISPFESMPNRSRFSSVRTEELAAGMAEGTVTLAGAATMPAASPPPSGTSLAAAQTAAAAARGGSAGSTLLLGSPTMPAIVPLDGFSNAAAPTDELPGPPALPTAPTLPAAGLLASGSSRPSDHSLAVASPRLDAGAGCLAEPKAAEAAASVASAEDGGEGEGPAMPMHPLCPLGDDVLPLDTSSLKSKQLMHSVGQLEHAEDEEAATAHLEALARLGWSDDVARQELGALQGVEMVVRSMRQYMDSDGVQCNGCLALMALVRGEGAASDTNRLCVADCGGVQVIAEGMQRHLHAPMVLLSALLCLVPLALENTYLQVTVARACLPTILAAMQAHVEEAEVVAKALVMLGVLGQGDEEAHELIRQAIMERTRFPNLTARVLRNLGTSNEDVLWSSLFALAVIARDTSQHYKSHLLALASAGVLPALETAMASYRATVEAQGTGPDDMILRAGDFLMTVLHTAHKLLWIRRTRRMAQLAIYGLAALTTLRWVRRRSFTARQPRH